MQWNWELKGWPGFRYHSGSLKRLDERFLECVGALRGGITHLVEDDKLLLTVEVLREESMSTSKIEGELLNRESVQSSIQQALGMKAKRGQKLPAREEGIGRLSVLLYESFRGRLTKSMLCSWHALLMQGSRDVKLGKFRSGKEPMQIISNRLDRPEIHFEAPPGSAVSREMTAFVRWFNAPERQDSLLGYAAIAHLYFLAVHPFEDGNGRIARAISQKALARSLGHPPLLSLSTVIEENRREYYRELEKTNTTLDVDDWVLWFGGQVIEGVKCSQKTVAFIIEKSRYFQKFGDQLNSRQEKALLRMCKEGPGGFQGGLSAENYIKITKAPRATATRDLQDLVAKGALRREGERRYTRYYLPF